MVVSKKLKERHEICAPRKDMNANVRDMVTDGMTVGKVHVAGKFHSFGEEILGEHRI
jgi:hypothetical protein